MTVSVRQLSLATWLACLALATPQAAAQHTQAAPPMAAPTPAPAYPPPSAAPGAYPAPPPGAYPPPQGGMQYAPGYDYRSEHQRRPRRSRGMMITGIALLGAGYLPVAIMGLSYGTQDRDQCDCRDALRLLIPVIGPLTLWKPNRDLNVLFNAVMVVDTLMQATGLLFTIFGIMRYNDSAREADEYGHKPRWSLGAVPLPGGAYGSFHLQL